MKIGLLYAFIFWYGLLSLAYVAIPSDIQEGTIDYTFVDDINASGFSEDEIDTGGFFSGLIGIGGAVARFFGFILFGFGLPDDTPQYAQTFVFFWNTIVTLLLIAWIVSIFWDG